MTDRTTLTSPSPGCSPIVTPEGIICGTDGSFRWVTQASRTGPCVLFTMNERTVSIRRVKGRAPKEEISHAFAVWVGGQSQPAQRFHPPKQTELSEVRRILACPNKNRIVLQRGLHRLPLQTEAAQFQIILDWLTQHSGAAVLTK